MKYCRNVFKGKIICSDHMTITRSRWQVLKIVRGTPRKCGSCWRVRNVRGNVWLRVVETHPWGVASPVTIGGGLVAWLTCSSSVFRPRDWTDGAVNQKVSYAPPPVWFSRPRAPVRIGIFLSGDSARGMRWRRPHGVRAGGSAGVGRPAVLILGIKIKWKCADGSLPVDGGEIQFAF